MKPNAMLTATSLLAILFMTLHLTDDVLRDQNGAAQGGLVGLAVPVVLIVWLYAVLVLAERQSGYIINLAASLLSSYVAFGHMTGIGDVVIGVIAKSSGPVFVWTVIALGVTAIFSVILSARALFSPQGATSANPTSRGQKAPRRA